MTYPRDVEDLAPRAPGARSWAGGRGVFAALIALVCVTSFLAYVGTGSVAVGWAAFAGASLVSWWGMSAGARRVRREAVPEVLGFTSEYVAEVREEARCAVEIARHMAEHGGAVPGSIADMSDPEELRDLFAARAREVSRATDELAHLADSLRVEYHSGAGGTIAEYLTALHGYARDMADAAETFDRAGARQARVRTLSALMAARAAGAHVPAPLARQVLDLVAAFILAAVDSLAEHSRQVPAHTPAQVLPLAAMPRGSLPIPGTGAAPGHLSSARPRKGAAQPT